MQILSVPDNLIYKPTETHVVKRMLEDYLQKISVIKISQRSCRSRKVALEKSPVWGMERKN